MTLTGTTAPAENGPRSNDSEEVLHILPSSKIYCHIRWLSVISETLVREMHSMYSTAQAD